MTPQEKAKELVNKFIMNVLDRDGTSAMNLFEVKQCVLIAVDELIELSKYTYGYYEWDYFYEEVKKELLNVKNK
jgi:hypothetical protein